MSNANVEKSRSIIEENGYLTLATCDGNTPWTAGIAYAVDENYDFYFYSAKNSRHAEQMKRNPNVAITIYNSTLPPEDVDGLQASGVVSRVKLTDLPRVMELYYRQIFTDELIREQWRQPISAFKGIAVKRFYKISLNKLYKLDLSTTEVDRRVEIDLNELRHAKDYA